MTDDELRKSLEQDLELLRQPGTGGFSNADNMRMHLESALLLESSNRNLAASSERLAKRNLWLTVAVFVVAVLQLFVAGFQVWLAFRSPLPSRASEASRSEYERTADQRHRA